MRIFAFLLPLFLFSACDTSVHRNFENMYSDTIAADAAFTPVAAPQFLLPSRQRAATSERKLIRTGYLHIRVEDVEKTKQDLVAMTDAYHAYISSERQARYNDKLEYEQHIRIPAAGFEGFIQKVETLAEEVESKNIETEDVSEEFIDKEARIKTKKELENRYRQILRQARLVPDILSIEAQLNQVRSDIESMEGRLNYLRNQVAFSTLTLVFYEPVGSETGFGARTIAAFANGWDILLISVISLIAIWPVLPAAAVAIYFLLRRYRWRRESLKRGSASA